VGEVAAYEAAATGELAISFTLSYEWHARMAGKICED